ncbi:MAG: hypothetical protein WCI04_05165 [archaeon]
MAESKYEQVDNIKRSNLTKEKSFKEGMQATEFAMLKAQDKINEKNITAQKKETDKSISSAKDFQLPIKTQQRFDREFGKAKEKNAYKTAMAIFFVAIVFAFFMQPSIFFIKNGNNLDLINYSKRELKNVSIYSFNDIVKGETKPMLFIEKFNPKTVLPIEGKETTAFLAFAERQMPAIGLFTLTNQNINNAGNPNSYEAGKTPQEMLDEMSNSNTGVDTNV